MIRLTDIQLGEILAASVEDEDGEVEQRYEGSYHRNEGSFKILGDTLLVGADSDPLYKVPFSIKKLRELLEEADVFLPADIPTDPEALLDLAAKTMAESTGLLWDKLSEEPDMVCSHGMPEGCKRYWRDLARIAGQIFTKPITKE